MFMNTQHRYNQPNTPEHIEIQLYKNVDNSIADI